eukprot:Platyproteum_vivax@DN5038_c0_g1_i1.p1
MKVASFVILLLVGNAMGMRSVLRGREGNNPFVTYGGTLEEAERVLKNVSNKKVSAATVTHTLNAVRYMIDDIKSNANMEMDQLSRSKLTGVGYKLKSAEADLKQVLEDVASRRLDLPLFVASEVRKTNIEGNDTPTVEKRLEEGDLVKQVGALEDATRVLQNAKHGKSSAEDVENALDGVQHRMSDMLPYSSRDKSVDLRIKFHNLTHQLQDAEQKLIQLKKDAESGLVVLAPSRRPLNIKLEEKVVKSHDIPIRHLDQKFLHESLLPSRLVGVDLQKDGRYKYQVAKTRLPAKTLGMDDLGSQILNYRGVLDDAQLVVLDAKKHKNVSPEKLYSTLQDVVTTIAAISFQASGDITEDLKREFNNFEGRLRVIQLDLERLGANKVPQVEGTVRGTQVIH